MERVLTRGHILKVLADSIEITRSTSNSQRLGQLRRHIRTLNQIECRGAHIAFRVYGNDRVEVESVGNYTTQDEICPQRRAHLVSVLSRILTFFH